MVIYACLTQFANSKASGGTVQNAQLLSSVMQLAALRYMVTFETSSPQSIFNGKQVAGRRHLGALTAHTSMKAPPQVGTRPKCSSATRGHVTDGEGVALFAVSETAAAPALTTFYHDVPDGCAVKSNSF